MEPRPTATIVPDGQHFHLIDPHGVLVGVFDTVAKAVEVADASGYSAVMP